MLRGVDGALAATCFFAGTLFAAGGLAFLAAVFVAAAFVFFAADRISSS